MGLLPQFPLIMFVPVLDQYSPNPYTTSTTIEYTLNQPQTVTITFYNQFGKQFDRIEQKQKAGKQQVTMNTRGLSAGIYFFTLKAGEILETGKLVKVD